MMLYGHHLFPDENDNDGPVFNFS